MTEETGNAMKLLQWLTSRSGDDISVRDIVSLAQPACADGSGGTITQHAGEHGWCRLEIVKTGGRDTKIVRLSPYARNAI